MFSSVHALSVFCLFKQCFFAQEETRLSNFCMQFLQVKSQCIFPVACILPACDLLRRLGDLLQEVNPLVHEFQAAAQSDDLELHLRIKARADYGPDVRRYNVAIAPEVALFRPDVEPYVDGVEREVILREQPGAVQRNGDLLIPVHGVRPGLRKIKEYNAAYDQGAVWSEYCFAFLQVALPLHVSDKMCCILKHGWTFLDN